MKFGYARVSTHDQNIDLQVDQLQQEGCDEILYEKRITMDITIRRMELLDAGLSLYGASLSQRYP